MGQWARVGQLHPRYEQSHIMMVKDVVEDVAELSLYLISFSSCCSFNPWQTSVSLLTKFSRGTNQADNPKVTLQSEVQRLYTFASRYLDWDDFQKWMTHFFSLVPRVSFKSRKAWRSLETKSNRSAGWCHQKNGGQINLCINFLYNCEITVSAWKNTTQSLKFLQSQRVNQHISTQTHEHI